MTKERTYRTLDESEEEYYRNHPDEIDEYLTTAFEEYAKDGCTAALLAQLRMIARVKGVTALSQETGITRNGIQKALSENGNPKFESINAIMNAMGYRLTPQRLDVHAK
ncbi:MAG: putative addiction module antidote protein [Nitrosomonas sp.]|jgi:probable addiction module antidote protein|nr:putative addiction module antidote protein [Nitrosomonas sp.]